MNTSKKSIGKRITVLRKAAGLTQLELAEKIDIHENNLSSIERGINGMSISTLAALCDVFNISADYILFGEKEKNTNTPLQNLIAKLDPDLQSYAEDIIQILIKMVEKTHKY